MSIPSPCIGVCRLHPIHSWCEGCYRTVDEITVWRNASDADKRQIMAQVAQRQQACDLFDNDLRGDCDR
jgi:uncharacterized protein